MSKFQPLSAEIMTIHESIFMHKGTIFGSYIRKLIFGGDPTNLLVNAWNSRCVESTIFELSKSFSVRVSNHPTGRLDIYRVTSSDFYLQEIDFYVTESKREIIPKVSANDLCLNPNGTLGSFSTENNDLSVALHSISQKEFFSKDNTCEEHKELLREGWTCLNEKPISQ